VTYPFHPRGGTAVRVVGSKRRAGHRSPGGSAARQHAGAVPACIPETHRQRYPIKANRPNLRAQIRYPRAPPTSAHPQPSDQISIAPGSHPTQPHARSFTGGFGTTASVQAESSRWAVIRNPPHARPKSNCARYVRVTLDSDQKADILGRLKRAKSGYCQNPVGFVGTVMAMGEVCPFTLTNEP
jgi:hypothetical protein